MAALVHQLAPLRVPEVTPKLDYLMAHRKDFDTVFIGSSRIYHGVSPKAFDAAMAAAGSGTHSFNLAVNGLMPPESLYVTRGVLKIGLPQLRRVFLEVAAARDLPDVESPTTRDIYWQDIEALKYGWLRAWQDFHTAPARRRWPTAWGDVSRSAWLFALNELNIGRLVPTGDLTKTANHMGAVMLGPGMDGYLPERHPLTEISRSRLAEDVAAMRSGDVPARPIDPLNEESYARIGDMLARRGIELVLVAPPSTLRDYHSWVDAPPGSRVLKFDVPDRFPELYAPANRFDSDHLNDLGAQIFSGELAAAYLAGK